MGKGNKPDHGTVDIIRQLIAYIDGRMNKKDRQKMAAKIAQDKDLQHLEKVVRELRRESRESDWAGIQGSVHSLLDIQLKQAKPGKKRKDLKKGVTTFDSKILPLPEGVRPATVDTRRVKYSVGQSLVEFALYPVSPSSYEIIGHLSGYTPRHDVTIEIRYQKLRFDSQANQFGLFRFPRVPEGAYRVIIKDGRQVIARLDLEI